MVYIVWNSWAPLTSVLGKSVVVPRPEIFAYKYQKFSPQRSHPSRNTPLDLSAGIFLPTVPRYFPWSDLTIICSIVEVSVLCTLYSARRNMIKWKYPTRTCNYFYIKLSLLSTPPVLLHPPPPEVVILDLQVWLLLLVFDQKFSFNQWMEWWHFNLAFQINYLICGLVSLAPGCPIKCRTKISLNLIKQNDLSLSLSGEEMLQVSFFGVWGWNDNIFTKNIVVYYDTSSFVWGKEKQLVCWHFRAENYWLCGYLSMERYQYCSV